ISPWNFPLAIFTGLASAPLAAGNAVIAKPAGQTPLIGALAVEMMHQAGIPEDVVQLAPRSGRVGGGALTAHPLLAGVVFTGSTETARTINRTLAERDGPIIPFIAATGGQNAMIVDRSALPEQVTRDVISSAFQSAGQRCSALRVLFVQEDVADPMIEMIAGAMRALKVGDPRALTCGRGRSAPRATLRPTWVRSSTRAPRSFSKSTSSGSMRMRRRFACWSRHRNSPLAALLPRAFTSAR